MSIKLVAIDLDETLLKRNKTYNRPWFRQILEQLTAQGILMFIVTGNTYAKVADYFDMDNKTQVYFGSDNGNYTTKNKQTERMIGLNQTQTRQLLDYIDRSPYGIHPVLSNGVEMYFRAEDGRAFDLIKQYTPGLKYIDYFSNLPEDTIATKLANMMDTKLEKSKEIAEEIYERFPFANAVTSGGGWMDIYHRDGGKGAAVEFLQEKYGITPAETMSFGDSLNDYSMMKVSEYSVAMGNADPELASICNYQIGTNEEQAVLQVLDQYLIDGNLNFMSKYGINEE